MIDRIANALMRADGFDPNNSKHMQAIGEHYRRTADLVLTELETAELTPRMSDTMPATPPTEVADIWRRLCAAARQG